MNIAFLYSIFKTHPHVQTDTRNLQEGDIYFALKGAHFNGNQFVAAAFQQGASYAVVDEKEAVLNERCLLVDDVLHSLQQLALYHRRQFHIPFIAITGTNGKTTTKELVNKVLSTQFKTYATQGNLNNHIGVPLTILSIKEDAEMAIIEMGANHIKEIAFYCTIAEPDFGLINNVGKAHLEGFGSLEGVKKAKGELYDYIRTHNGTIFINNDLPYLSEMAHDISKLYSYGTHEGKVIGKALTTDSGLLDVAILSSGMETTIPTQLVGDYNLPNVLAAVAIGTYFGVNIDIIKSALTAYVPSNNRSQLMHVHGNTLILDAYNANPSSMKLAIENIANMPNTQDKWLLLGAMKEMGDSSHEEHMTIVDQLEALHLDNVILVGQEFKEVAKDYHWFADAYEAKNWLEQQNIHNATILIKGSRGAQMEVVSELFKK